MCICIYTVYIRETGQFSSKGIINDFIGNLKRLTVSQFFNEAKMYIKIHQLSKNLEVCTCVAFVFKGFPFVVHLCRKVFLRSR